MRLISLHRFLTFDSRIFNGFAVIEILSYVWRERSLLTDLKAWRRDFKARVIARIGFEILVQSGRRIDLGYMKTALI